jgi:hypothetical protein
MQHPTVLRSNNEQNAKYNFSEKTVECLQLIILARKSEKDPLPYCKTRAEPESNNPLGPHVSAKLD